jgi:hypothetical protein
VTVKSGFTLLSSSDPSSSSWRYTASPIRIWSQFGVCFHYKYHLKNHPVIQIPYGFSPTDDIEIKVRLWRSTCQGQAAVLEPSDLWPLCLAHKVRVSLRHFKI